MLIMPFLTIGPAIAADAPPVPAKPVKEFTLFPVAKPFRLADAKGKYVALHFLLKTECPYCLRYTHDYAARAAELPGVVNVFIKPDAVEATAKWMENLDKRDLDALPTIYRDEDAGLAKAFGVPDGYAFHGQRVHYPALILLDPAGIEVFRYVGTANTDRLPFDRFAAKIAELKAGRKGE
jgi:peroxiredoxin Q/BCP